MTTRGNANPVQKAIALAKEKGCVFVDLKFIDLPGTWQHYTLPIGELTELARSRLTRSLSEEECRRYLRLEACAAAP